MTIKDLFDEDFTIQSSPEKVKHKKCCLCEKDVRGEFVIDIDNKDTRLYACKQCADNTIMAMVLIGCDVKMSRDNFYARKRG